MIMHLFTLGIEIVYNEAAAGSLKIFLIKNINQKMSPRKITTYIHKRSGIPAKIRLSVTKITSEKTEESLRHCNALSHIQYTHPILIIQYSQSSTLHFSNYVSTHIINIKNKHSMRWFISSSHLLFICFSCLLFGLLITGLFSTGITSLLELNISALSSPPTIPT